MNTPSQVFLLPIPPLYPPWKLALRQPTFLVVNHSLAPPPLSRRIGDVAHLVEQDTRDGQLGHLLTVVGTGDGDQVAVALHGPEFLVRG